MQSDPELIFFFPSWNPFTRIANYNMTERYKRENILSGDLRIDTREFPFNVASGLVGPTR